LTVVQAPTITTTEVPDGQTGVYYEVGLTTTGGGTPPTWQVTDGRFPTGLALDEDGLIHGTPLYGGQYQFTVTATDGFGASDAQDLTLTVPAPACTEPPFPDVPVDSPSCAAIAWITDRGITTGYPDGWFHAERPVTRQTMAGFLYRYTHAGDTA